MSPRSTLALGCAAAMAAGSVAGCGAPDQRDPGSYDPRVPVVDCLRGERVEAGLLGRDAVRAGGVRIQFLATPGEAEGRQISGGAQGAEQIGRALIWVQRAPDDLVQTIEGCVDR
jgi:hypothetical protein